MKGWNNNRRQHLTIPPGEALRHIHACKNLLGLLLCAAVTSAGCFADSRVWLDEIADAQYRYSHEEHHPAPPGPVGVVAPVALRHYSKSGLWVTIEEVTDSCFSYRVVRCCDVCNRHTCIVVNALCFWYEVMFSPVSWLVCRFASRITQKLTIEFPWNFDGGCDVIRHLPFSHWINTNINLIHHVA